eukprot:scaffold13_cov241-Pinguiococcus_pyrenoidosus.AAC.14
MILCGTHVEKPNRHASRIRRQPREALSNVLRRGRQAQIQENHAVLDVDLAEPLDLRLAWTRIRRLRVDPSFSTHRQQL